MSRSHSCAEGKKNNPPLSGGEMERVTILGVPSEAQAWASLGKVTAWTSGWSNQHKAKWTASGRSLAAVRLGPAPPTSTLPPVSIRKALLPSVQDGVAETGRGWASKEGSSKSSKRQLRYHTPCGVLIDPSNTMRLLWVPIALLTPMEISHPRLPFQNEIF